MNASASVEPVGDLVTRIYIGGANVPTTTFVAPRTGVYRFYLWGGSSSYQVYDYGPGYDAQVPTGGTGALARIDRRMKKGESVTLIAGGAGALSRATFADGYVVTAGQGGAPFSTGPGMSMGGPGGVATGGDINIDGSQGGGMNGGPWPGNGTDGGAQGTNLGAVGTFYWGGAGAPGLDGLRGGKGGNAASTGPTAPGGGGAYQQPGAAGLIFIIQRS